MDATDIVDVVKEFVSLRKAGVNYKGLCPFHNEKTPSFTVSPAKQMCKCFSCGKGGNAVNFLMQLEQMTYPEALRWLARKYGIEVKEKEMTDDERAAQNERESLYAVNEWANKYFQDVLRNNVDGVAKGMAYFRQRGFRDEVIRKFQLGYSLEERDAMAKAALAHGFKEEYLIQTGVCYRTDDGRLLDRYHGRVIFPVHTVSGKTVAFGGRILSTDKKLAKYVNSPESTIYSKSHELYGLYLAKNAIVRQDRCFLVEGYTDVISMHQSGVENVVASSGTSLTEGQIRLLHRFTENITVLYDGDAAGIKASLRGIDMLLSEGLNIKVLLLPDGEDPDSFARKHRASDFQAYIDAHQVDFIRFKTDLLLQDAANDPIKRAELITDVVKSISVIPNTIVRQMYISECAGILAVSEELIVNEINKQVRKRQNSDGTVENERNAPQEPQPEDLSGAGALALNVSTAEEKLLVSVLVRYGGLPMEVAAEYAETGDETAENGRNPDETGGQKPTVSVAQYIARDLETDGLVFRNALYRKVLEEAAKCAAEDSQWEALPYFLRHPDTQVSALAAEVGMDNFELSTRQREQYIEEKYRLDELVPRLLHDFKHAIVKERLKGLLMQLRDPRLLSNPEGYEALMREFMELSAVERQFAQVLGDRVVLK